MRSAFAAAFFCLLAFAGVLAQPSPAQDGDLWWKHAVVYEVYPRSFQDSNNDGVGDIRGIERRLDYLKDLGIDGIWITPMYPSPQVDFGYDISDYRAIDPQYGTMDDFDALMKSAKARNLRVIMDIVLNHTSDQHPWFKESRSSRTNPKRDWYIWRDGKNGGPPNNWQSWFGHSAWTLDPATGQYYYHYFYTQQPDLNWRNPEVRKAMFDIVKFWLDKGVAGFRLDAVSRLFEDPQMRDDPYLPGYNAYGDRNIQHKFTDDLPEVHDVLRDLRKLVDSYPGHPVLISEADEPTIADLSKMYGAHNDEVQLPMDFQIADVNQLSAPKFRKLFEEVENNPAHGWPEYFFSNHDQPRQWDRYGDGVHNDQIAKLMAALELLPRGTQQMYYGEEIGMRTTDPKRIEDVRDPIGRTGWPKEKGRDGERTPMQWTPEMPNAGFTAPNVKPWLPVPPSAKTINVQVESGQFESLLNFYKALLKMRHTEPALVSGDYVTLNPDDPDVFSFLRTPPNSGRSVLVALNMSSRNRTISFAASESLKTRGSKGQATHVTILKSSYPTSGTVKLDQIDIPAFGALVLGVE
ncbi:MAG: alpha-glucosidase [Acidobacteria bacterium]|nr:alpha-glucosidase [Acidobacteriota bacterium]